LTAVKHLYERFDGEGFPSQLSGSGIPLLARMLSVAVSYVDLAFNPNNFLGKTTTHTDALTLMREDAGRTFDPDVVDALAFAIGHDRF
jgi:response regulator RpfG family c-di-GMP phosphodiesterase